MSRLKRRCMIGGCAHPHVAHGLCSRHLSAQRRRARGIQLRIMNCPCGRPATERCGLCHRRLCPRHSALRPLVAAPGRIAGGNEPACMPRCEAEFWLAPALTKEWKPSGLVLADVEAAW